MNEGVKIREKKRKRNNSKAIKEGSSRGEKTVYVAEESDRYNEVINKATTYREWLDSKYATHPELFPKEMDTGYTLHSIEHSKKQEDFVYRRICLKTSGECYTIKPSYMLPYNVGGTEAVEKGLYLRKFGLPYHAITYVLGKNDSYWHRIELGIGRLNIVGTTIQKTSDLPSDIASDEKHTEHLNDRVYACLTVSEDVVLGVGVSEKADTESLTKAYEVFQQESEAVDENYSPQTNNRDGWEAGLNAFKALFPKLTLIHCFLHEWLKVKTRCRSLKKVFQEGRNLLSIVGEKIWEIYEAESKEMFEKRIDTFQQWVAQNIEATYPKEQLERFCTKARTLLSEAYEHSGCLRTSNAVDRPMKRLDRFLFNIQYFHGHLQSAHLMLRAWGLIYNFAPYNPKTQKQLGVKSPAHKVNQFYYHENWLHNLLISGSLNGGKHRNRL